MSESAPSPLEDPALFFWGGGNLAKGPMLGYQPPKLKTQRIHPNISSDGSNFVSTGEG